MSKEKTFELKDLSEQELNVILNGLASLPYGQVWQLVAKMQQQFSSQNQVSEVCTDIKD